MITFDLLAAIALGYVAFLFAVAAVAERMALRGRSRWLNSPLVYTLALSIYCTAWTFYGAVGYAARSGLEYLTIYLGPSLVMIGWWWILRKLVRIGRSQRITSIADLISSRFGKSTTLGVIVTLICVIGITPYIALQLQSLSLSFGVFSEFEGAEWERSSFNSVALWSAVGLTFFTVLFGTRNLDTNERHHGVVMAIAVEAVVKLFALISVGVFVVWGLGSGVGDMMDRIAASDISTWDQPGGRWIGLTFLAAAAFLCLPRMFHVLVVENSDERNLLTASWAFPTYVMLMSLFVVPIAVAGLERLPAGSNPDLFVLTLPHAEGRDGLAALAFLGGFSSATSMVIVATIALATMVSNHIVLPIWLRSTAQGAVISGDVRMLVLNARRLSIGAVMALGYIYYRMSGGSAALASIGLIAFAGLAQILPAMLGGIFWRGATRIGAAAGLLIGFGIWCWTLFLPSFGEGAVLSAAVFAEGPFGIGWLRPQALFGTDGLDPLLHAVFWSMALNTAGFVIGSLLTFPTPLERLQGAQFVNVFEQSPGVGGWAPNAAQAEDLLLMAQRIIGAEEAQAHFQRAAALQGRADYLPDVTPEFVQSLERELAGSVGAATAHAMVSQVTQGAAVSVEDLMAVADEAAQILEYSNQLEAKSAELELTARALREANNKLTAMSMQKDAFLSQVSHELRTPMTSIRSFSEILRDTEGMGQVEKTRYASIIHGEAIRLTRLLDDLLDLSVLENGQVSLRFESGRLSDLIEQSIVTAQAASTRRMDIRRRRVDETLMLTTDLDRLGQVFINLITNAQKYCDAEAPELVISVHNEGDDLSVAFRDNGTPIPDTARSLIFEKFARIGDQDGSGAGLGLAICREIMARLGGDITHVPAATGNTFVVHLPRRAALAAQ